MDNRWLIHTYLILVLIFSAPIVSSGQGVVKDFETRAGVGYGVDISKKIDFTASHELRIGENSTLIRRSLTTLGLDYKLVSWLRFGINYRAGLNRKGDGTYGMRHRFMGDVVLRENWERFTFTNRIRFQQEYRTINYTSDIRGIPYSDLRNTIKINYRINQQYRPYVSYDIRFLFREPGRSVDPFQDRIRYVVGLDTEFSKTSSLGIYFMYSGETNVVEPVQRYIIGLEYNFGAARPMLGT